MFENPEDDEQPQRWLKCSDSTSLGLAGDVKSFSIQTVPINQTSCQYCPSPMPRRSERSQTLLQLKSLHEAVVATETSFCTRSTQANPYHIGSNQMDPYRMDFDDCDSGEDLAIHDSDSEVETDFDEELEVGLEEEILEYPSSCYQRNIHDSQLFSFNDPNEILSHIATLESLRYWVPRHKTAPLFTIQEWFHQLKFQNARNFRTFFRMSENSFYTLVDKLKEHPVFTNKSTLPQLSPIYQIAVFLYRLGGKSGNSSHAHMALAVGIGEGTVSTYCNRVIEAVMSLRNTYIKWPSQHEKRAHKQRVCVASRNVFSGCVGFVDGTYITLEYAPEVNWYSYFNRKSSYGLNAMVVCNDNNRILYMRVGDTSAVHDARVFSNSQLSKRSADFFEPDEYLIGDSAYTCTKSMITPFKKPRSQDKYCALFNSTLSSRRIAIEHVFGQLKGRFPSVTAISIRIKGPESHRACVRWFESACIIYNHLIDNNDAIWDDREDLEWAEHHQAMIDDLQKSREFEEMERSNGRRIRTREDNRRELVLLYMKERLHD